MKTQLLKYVLLLALMLPASGCGDFEDTNIDPNNTTEVAPEALLAAALRSTRWIADSYTGNLWTQYIAQITYNLSSRYNWANFDFNFWYADALINLEKVIQMNTDEATRERARISGSNNNQIAVARILKSFYFHFLTDRWGPLPYSEALKGRADFKPAYDSQEDIYRGIFKELREAVDQIDEGPPVQGDFMLNGNMDMWRKFANSIRMIAALRLSKVAPDLARTEFVDAMNAGGLTSVEENISYPFLADANNENPWYTRFRTQQLEGLSNTLVDKLLQLNDPRLHSYGDPSVLSGEHHGMPYGIDNPTEDPADISWPHSQYVRGQDTPLPLVTYAQLLFGMAEAAQLGWIGGDAAEYYYEGIKASLKQWFVNDPEVYQRYIAQPAVAWNSADPLPLIGEQKWIALFPQGYESWAEWRRTGYPHLDPAPAALNTSGQIPRRQAYPITERDLNNENWQHAVDTWLGGEDGLDSRLWWDVQ